MDRRAALAFGLFSIMLLPVASPAQPRTATYRIGWLDAALQPSGPSASRDALEQGLVGHVNLGDVIWVDPYAPGRDQGLPALAARLVNAKVEVIVAVGNGAVEAAKRATTDIPVVMVAADAARAGLVENLTKPGGNVTGVTYASAEVNRQRLRLLRQLVPTLSQVAVLQNLADPGTAGTLNDIRLAGEALTITVEGVDIRDGPDVVEGLLSRPAAQRPHAWIVPGDPSPSPFLRRIVALAAKARIPAIYGYRPLADAGGLMAYGPNVLAMYRRAGSYVGEILKGAKPGDLPVQQPTRFDLVINVKTANALGLTVPPSLLLRADQVIQ